MIFGKILIINNFNSININMNNTSTNNKKEIKIMDKNNLIIDTKNNNKRIKILVNKNIANIKMI